MKKNEASEAWINEPSGLSRSGLASSDDLGELLIAVDDEESAVFILEAGPNHFPLVRSLLSLRDKNNKAAAEDLEAVTYDGNKYYYAIASHRQLGDQGKARRTRRLLKFKVPSDAWKNGYLNIVVESSIDLTAPPEGKNGLKQFLDENGITVERWNERGDLPQMYGLEIEGMTYSSGQLYIGLRWPLDKKSALLISYNIQDREFNWLRRLDLDGQGITALETSGEYLIVASNPPQKADLKVNPSSSRYYGNSGLWAFPIVKIASDESNIIEGKRLFLESKPDAKLEGVAVVDSRIFLSFDGEKPYFVSAPLPKL